MKRCIAVLSAVLFLAPALVWCQANLVFEATVIRVQPWPLLKVTCGRFANYRLAEYKVDVVYSGTVSVGQNIVAQHLACSYNELDDLKVGDKVLVVASALLRPQTAQWDTTRSGAKKSDNVTVSYSADRVAKVVYAIEEEPLRSP